jgi:hypothetical protein
MDLARLKPRWGVSIQALIYRAHELDMLSDRQYRYFFEQITKLGWRKREPEEFDVKAEKPRLFTKLAEIAFGQFVSVDKVADTVCLPTILAQQILAIHAQKADLQKNEPAEIVPVPLVTETPRNNLIQFSRK